MEHVVAKQPHFYVIRTYIKPIPEKQRDMICIFGGLTLNN